MNKNSIIGFILIAAIMVGYSIWMTPSKEELAARQRKQDSIDRLIKMRNDSIAKAQALQKEEEKPVAQTESTEQTVKPENSIQTGNNSSEKYNDLKQKFGVFTNSSIGTDTTFLIENDVFKLKISKK